MTRFLLTDAVRAAWGGVSFPPELPLIEWAAQFVPEGRNALDIGAHVGSWCVTLAGRTKARQWHAFEPQLKTYNALCGSIAFNALDEKITAHNVGISDQDGLNYLKIISPDGGGSRLVGDEVVIGNEHIEDVEVKTINGMGFGGTVGFIKIDVEGHELAVLDGAKNTLKYSGYPPIIFECWQHDWFKADRDALYSRLKNDLGYTLTPITGWSEMTLAEHRS